MRHGQATVLAWHRTSGGAQRLRALVAASPLARLEALESSPRELERRAAHHMPEIILLETPGGINGTAELIRRLRRVSPRSAVMVLSDSKDPEDILTALRLGVVEYLTEPAEPKDFNQAVLRLAGEEAAGGRPHGRVISLMGAKGGVGTSSLALNLAWHLSRKDGCQVALVDLDLSAGDLAWMLDQKDYRDLSEVAANFQHLDDAFLKGLLSEVSSGLHFLAAPADPVVAEEVKSEHLSLTLRHLANSHHLVVLDLPSRLDELSLVALEEADLVVLVLEPTILGLRAARRLLELGEGIWQEGAKPILAVNRLGAKGALPKAEIQRSLADEEVFFLPDDGRTLLEAANTGRPALSERPRAKWSRAVGRLAERLMKRGEEDR